MDRRTFAIILGGAAVGGCRLSTPPRVLRMALPWEVDALDPHVTSTAGTFSVLGNIFEPLVASDPSLGVHPGLARSWSSPDPLTWMFELDPTARFHSGRAVTARDVVFNLERLRDPKLELNYYVGDIAGVEAVDEHTVRIRALRPAPVLLHKLGHIFMVPEGATTASLEKTPDGTGPYKIEQWTPGRELVLARHDAYRGPRPALDRVTILLGRREQEALDDLLAGRLDMALVPGHSRGLDPARFELRRRSTLHVRYIAFDLSRAETPEFPGRPNPFRDPRVREAFDVGVDRLRLTAGLPGEATPASQLVPRLVFGFNPALPDIAPDRARARALLAEAGFGGGLRAVLHTRELLREPAEAVAAQLRDAGIELTVDVRPDLPFFAAVKEGRFSLWLDRWACTTGDSAELFETALHTRQPERGYGTFNEAGFSDPALDREIEAALQISQPEHRRDALQELMARVVKDRVWIPLFSDDDLFAVDRRFSWQPRSDYRIHLVDITPRGR